MKNHDDFIVQLWLAYLILGILIFIIMFALRQSRRYTPVQAQSTCVEMVSNKQRYLPEKCFYELKGLHADTF